MQENNILTLIRNINDPMINNLQDISKLSFNAFLRRAEKALSFADCYFLYQQAVHTSGQAVRRAQFMRGNPQLANNPLFQANSVSTMAALTGQADEGQIS